MKRYDFLPVLILSSLLELSLKTVPVGCTGTVGNSLIISRTVIFF